METLIKVLPSKLTGEFEMLLKLLVAALITAFSIAGNTMELNKVSFLLGCWENTNEVETSMESWTRHAKGHFHGKAKTIKNGKLVFWDDLRPNLGPRVL